MAEPISPLPASTPKTESVPRPRSLESVPPRQQGSREISTYNLYAGVGTVDQIRSRLRRSYGEIQQAVWQAISQANRKFRRLANERPMQLVLGVAIASFVAGAALRIWRSNHD
jgi:hypothetical protein